VLSTNEWVEGLEGRRRRMRRGRRERGEERRNVPRAEGRERSVRALQRTTRRQHQLAPGVNAHGGHDEHTISGRGDEQTLENHTRKRTQRRREGSKSNPVKNE